MHRTLISGFILAVNFTGTFCPSAYCRKVYTAESLPPGPYITQISGKFDGKRLDTIRFYVDKKSMTYDPDYGDQIYTRSIGISNNNTVPDIIIPFNVSDGEGYCAPEAFDYFSATGTRTALSFLLSEEGYGTSNEYVYNSENNKWEQTTRWFSDYRTPDSTKKTPTADFYKMLYRVNLESPQVKINLGDGQSSYIITPLAAPWCDNKNWTITSKGAKRTGFENLSWHLLDDHPEDYWSTEVRVESYDLPILINEGDLDGDGKDEIGLWTNSFQDRQGHYSLYKYCDVNEVMRILNITEEDGIIDPQLCPVGPKIKTDLSGYANLRIALDGIFKRNPLSNKIGVTDVNGNTSEIHPSEIKVTKKILEESYSD